MSGVGEASIILSLISGILTILDAAKKTYDAVHDPSGLPDAFTEVAQRLHLIKDTLDIISEHVQRNKKSLKAETMTAIQDTLGTCEKKAKRLQEIFDKCIPDEDASRFDRYVKALKSVSQGKADKIELLMKALLEGMQEIVNYIGITTAGEMTEGMKSLTEAIEAMSTMPPSVDDKMIEPEGVYGHNVHTGSGDVYSASDKARQQINRGNNSRNYQADTMSFGKED